MAAVPKLDPTRYYALRFEDLLARPRDTIRDVADFLELPHLGGAWLDAAAARVRTAPPSRVAELPADEAERLREACRPGNALLGRA